MGVVRATSDLHLSQRSSKWVFEALEALRADAASTGGHTVLVGDILDQPESVHMPTWNRLRDVLRSFKGTVIVAVGNHDQYDGQRNALEALEGGSVRVISAAQMTGVGLVVPYVPPADFWKTVKRASAEWVADGGDPEFTRTWWTHQGWRGSYLNNMHRDRDGLSCKQIDADLVISGHYHMPQNLGPIIYCGSPWQTSFAEEGQVKGWLRWDEFDARKPEIPRRVPFETSAPRHHTVLWDVRGGDNPVKPEGYRKGDRVRIVANGTRADVKKAAKAVKKAGLEGASIVADSEGSRREVIDRRAGPIEAAIQYIDRVHGPDEATLTPIALHEWALEAGVWSQ